jgi:phosphate acetyltransferase
MDMPDNKDGSTFDTLIESCKNNPPLPTAVVHPVSGHVLQAVADAAKNGLIAPILIGPENRIRQAAKDARIDITAWPLITTEHSHAAAAKAVEMAVAGQAEAIMKGALHTDEIMHAVIMASGLRTERRVSHAYVMQTPYYHKPFLVTDAAINIAPDLAVKTDIVQNAINLWRVLFGEKRMPKVALLAAVETINPKMQATLDAAALCKMAERGQIKGGIVDGPLAMDNAINREAALEKGITSDVAGDADILVAPDIESANILAKELTFLGNAEAAGVILGARVPIILTSRADSLRTRLLSCILAVKLAAARREGALK